MKKKISEPVVIEDDDMRSEYNFTGGVRGKHCRDLRQGYSVKVHQSDGTTLIQNFRLEEGAVILAPDVQKYFPDSEAVNMALRCLIPLVATKHGA